MAVFPHGSARGGSRSDGPQQIKDLRADDFYGDSHDGNDGSRGSHDTTRNARTYTLPTFAEATDASEAMRERRADRNKSIAMRVLAAVLILTALGIGMFPRVLQYRSARELASTSARSEKRVAGWPYPQADEAFAAAREYNKRLAKSGQPVIGEAKDPLAELYDDPQNAANNASADGSDNSGDSASAKDKEYQSLLDSGDGVMGGHPHPEDFREPAGLPRHVRADACVRRGSPVRQQPAGGLDSETAISIIRQQARRIDELQRENEDLRAKLDELTA